MASTYTSNLRLEKPGIGEQSDQWGNTLNDDFGLIDFSIAGMTTVNTTGGNTTLTTVNGDTDQARAAILKITGTLVSNATIIVPDVTKLYSVYNATSGAFTVTIKASGTGVEVAQSVVTDVMCDGTVVRAVSSGGTGTSTVFTTTEDGLVPAPGAGNTTKYLRGDGTWTAVTAAGSEGDPYWNNVVLAMHMNGPVESTTFIDETGKAVTAHGDARIANRVKFGSGSLLTSSTRAGYLSLADSDDWTFGTGDFTIDCWVFLGDYGYIEPIIGQWSASGAGKWQLYIDSTGYPSFALSTVTIVVSPLKVTLGEWTHIEIVGYNQGLYLYVGGVLRASYTTTAVDFTAVTDALEIGRVSSAGTPSYAALYIDDLRITKGIARHTADFSVPTAEFSDTTGTSISIEQGLHTIWVPAVAMVSRTTSGAASGTTETATNKVMLKTLDFDTAANEYAQFTIQMPKSWNEGTVTASFVWSHAATTTNFGVRWAIQGVAISNAGALDTAFGTAVGVSDTGGTTDTLYDTGATSAMTIGNTPAAQDWVVFQIYRDVADGADTMAIDARLHGVSLYYTIDASTDV